MKDILTNFKKGRETALKTLYSLQSERSKINYKMDLAIQILQNWNNRFELD
jgi:hypothetical protein